ncbi:noc2p family isoform X2 [Wolffia australiana]
MAKIKKAPRNSDQASKVKSDGTTGENIPASKKAAKEHMQQLQRLEEKDPEFYQFLKEYDKELLEFNDEGLNDEGDTDVEESESQDAEDALDEDEIPGFTSDDVELDKLPRKLITTAMIDLWSEEIKNNQKLSAIRSSLRAFRSACHCGDDDSGNMSGFSIVSSGVFNKIMVLVLGEMDKALRGLLKFPPSGGKRETVLDLANTKLWKKYGSLVKLYLGNALHVLNQMTDEDMISFTLKRLKPSAVFLAAFPVLLRKYVKVLLHFWGTGGGALQVVSFLFLRDLCIRLGADCLDTCLRGVYKAYVMNCKIKGKHASPSKLQHIQFLGNCVAELCGVDLSSTYQLAFIYIRQLASVLRASITEKPNVNLNEKNKEKPRKGQTTESGSKKAYLKVYDWQFLSCLELWTGVICAYSSDPDFRLLAYPLTQIIFGVARLVPTARYLPIRLRCSRMLNRISSSTGSFIPVSLLLLEMLEMKEVNAPPTGGVGKAVDMFTRKLVGKPTMKTRGFQEACVLAVIEQLADHLAEWSYSIAFFELSFVPLVRLRSFCKTTRNDRFRRYVKELVRQVEANVLFTNAKRGSTDLLPNSPAVASFLQAEKEAGASPLTKFVETLQLRAQQRADSLQKSSLLVGEKSSRFSSRRASGESEEDEDDDATDGEDSADEAGTKVFNSSWLPNPRDGEKKQGEEEKKKKSRTVAVEDDVVEDLILSSDDDQPPDEDLHVSSEDDDHDDQSHVELSVQKKRKNPRRLGPTKRRKSQHRRLPQ